MEGSFQMDACEKKAAEVNIINWKNIRRHNEQGKYQYICIRTVQVYIRPLHDFGKNVKCLSFVCDIRHRQFYDQVISGITCNLSQGVVSYVCEPKYYVSLEDKFRDRFLAVKLLAIGSNMHEGARNIQIKWKVIYKLVNTIDEFERKRIIHAEKYEIGGGPKKKITTVKVNPNEIEIERT